MIYPYIVNKNGVWYPAGADVPDDTRHITTDNLTEKPVYNGRTKTEINRMSTAELKELALENDIDDAEQMTGAELKKVLIEKFGL